MDSKQARDLVKSSMKSATMGADGMLRSLDQDFKEMAKAQIYQSLEGIADTLVNLHRAEPAFSDKHQKAGKEIAAKLTKAKRDLHEAMMDAHNLYVGLDEAVKK